MLTETNVNNQSKSKSKSGKREANGQIKVETKTEALQASIVGTGFEYNFDSNTPDKEGTSPLEVLRKVHQGMLKQVTVTTHDKDNKIVSIEIQDNVLPSLPLEVQALVRDDLDPETLKKKAIQEQSQLTSDPVSPGDTWERSDTQSLGGGQSMTFQTTYKYEGPVTQDGKQFHRISGKATAVTYNLEGGVLPLTLKGSKLNVDKSEIEILFDREAGRAVCRNRIYTSLAISTLN